MGRRDRKTNKRFRLAGRFLGIAVFCFVFAIIGANLFFAKSVSADAKSDAEKACTDAGGTPSNVKMVGSVLSSIDCAIKADNIIDKSLESPFNSPNICSGEWGSTNYKLNANDGTCVITASNLNDLKSRTKNFNDTVSEYDDCKALGGSLGLTLGAPAPLQSGDNNEAGRNCYIDDAIDGLDKAACEGAGGNWIDIIGRCEIRPDKMKEVIEKLAPNKFCADGSISPNGKQSGCSEKSQCVDPNTWIPEIRPGDMDPRTGEPTQTTIPGQCATPEQMNQWKKDNPENNLDKYKPTPTSPPPDDGGNGESACNVPGAMGWITCNVLGSLSEGAEKLYAKVASFLVIDDSTIPEGVETYYYAFIPLANMILIIVFLAIIYSEATGNGFGALSNYSIKKVLPRLIIYAVLVNLSLYICVAGIDLSNILGTGIPKLVEGGGSNAIDGEIHVPGFKSCAADLMKDQEKVSTNCNPDSDAESTNTGGGN